MAYKISSVASADFKAQKVVGFWSDPRLMTAVAGALDLEPKLILCYKGEELLASLPIYEKSRLGIKYLVHPSLSYYQALDFYFPDNVPAARRGLDELGISKEMAVYLKGKYRKTGINLAPQNQDVRGFVWSGFRAKPLYTYTWNTSDTPQALTDERKKLKVAESRGYTHDESFEPESFMKLYREMNLRKKQNPGISMARIQDFFVSLHKQGLLIQKNLRLDGEIVSANYTLGNGKGTGYTVIRASKEQEMAYGVSSLHTMILLESLGDRYSEIDFCGANVADVARFKAAMGLSLKIFFHIET